MSLNWLLYSKSKGILTQINLHALRHLDAALH